MDDDDFGDDDLDTISDNTLHDLEHNAITSTQKTRTAAGAGNSSRIQTFGVSGLSRTSNWSRAAWRPPQVRQQAQPNNQHGAHTNVPDPPSSDYGFDEGDVIDLDEPSMVIRPSGALPLRGPTQQATVRSGRYASRTLLDPETEAAFAAADAELGVHCAGQWRQETAVQPHEGKGGADVVSLQARIANLETEQARLQQLEQEARNVAQAKQGEIAIVRANQEKATKEYERRIAVMQKLHADESAKQRAELEQGKKEREKMKTDNRFLQHDLAQEAEKAKRLTGPGKARVVADTGKTTPRKNRRTELGDGFEDDEVRLISPSKSKDKSREQTPKVGAKRKRQAHESPLPALSFDQQSRPATEEQIPARLERSEASIHSDERYGFMQRLLNHCPYEDADRSLETLTKFALPSNPTRSLCSILMNGVTSPYSSSETYLPLKLCRVVLSCWSECLKERFYSPIYLLLDLIRFALYLEPASTTSQLNPDAVSLCTRTIDLAASPIARAARHPAYASTADFKAWQTDIEPHIDADEIIEFLQQLCDAASLDTAKTQEYWKSIELTFVLQMLDKAQPLSRITAALVMLRASALPQSFGPICTVTSQGEGEEQAVQERHLVEKLTNFLFEVPLVPSDEPTYTDEEIAKLRIEVLELLKILCLNDHGGMLLAQHRSAIGRLIRFLDGQVSKLYLTRPSLGLLSTHDSLHDSIAVTINITTRLLYHLLLTYENMMNFQQKLSVVKGGYPRFLVSMSRIAFSDQLVLEQGIEDETLQAAHMILDNILSPEEGEAIMKAVETPRGTRSYGGTTEKNTESQSSQTEAEGEDGLEAG